MGMGPAGDRLLSQEGGGITPPPASLRDRQDADGDGGHKEGEPDQPAHTSRAKGVTMCDLRKRRLVPALRRGGELLLLGWVALALLALPGGEAWGSALGKVRDQEIVQTLKLRVGQSRVLKLPFAITRIAVANPEVADIILTSPREVYVNGLSPGVTSLSVWGKNRFSSARVSVEADISQLKEQLAKVLPKEKIGVMAADEAIVLTGEVSGPVAQQTAATLAAAFVGGKKERVINLLNIGGVQQVLCEVRLAEINRNVAKRLGVNFAILDKAGYAFGVSTLNNLTGISDFVRNFGGTSITQSLSTNVNALAGWKTGTVLWTMFFDALKQQGLGRILAEPNLVATSGQEASFLAGGEFPIPVPQQFQTITIEFKKFGVGLNFTPTVLENDMIAMKVAPEVSELDFTTGVAFVAQGFVVPGLSVRRLSTHVEVKDGQTFAIAGLLSDSHRNVINKFPLLGDLPILGPLFRSSNFQKRETELVVLVTPRLVKPMAQGTPRLPTDAYVEPDDLEFYLLGCLEGREKKKPQPPAQGPLPGDFGRQPVK
jgi:pilus assembly protein CpaC